MSCYTSQEQKQPMLIEGNNLTIPKNWLKKKKKRKRVKPSEPNTLYAYSGERKVVCHLEMCLI